MSRKHSLLQACLTPRAQIPRSLAMAVTAGLWIALFAIWCGLTYGGVMPAIFLPTPGAVFEALFRMIEEGTLGRHVFASVEVVVLGFLISSAVAVPVGILSGSFRVVQAAVEPLVNFMRYLPVTSFVPLFILWIGIGAEQRITVIVFGTIFQQLIMVADIARRVPNDLLNAAYTLGASRRDALLHVLLPAALPSIIDMLRVTMGWAWTYLVLAELVAASSGLGYISLRAARGFQVDVIFLAIAIIGLLGLCTDQFFRLLRLRATSWAR
ncbi:ABC transporter permease [Zavarzinia aquatilis]|uniref:ABC transporter permease n=1 Tax=Zavarzinia aquatilis TaxID=2211142 RepID=A0A317DXQ4_9PROT|nr:ABC transporter permease [Zavarzinia aquatilis]PWR19508.1 ABC transporter permease [Zavarzinia aquatilis]